MPQSRRKPATKPEEPKASEQLVDGVFVVKMTDEKGNITTQVVPNGDVRLTEVPTLLELAINKFRADVGLGQGSR